MSTSEQSEYTAPVPLVYRDGDTRIAFPWGVYVLHSTILSLKSEYLRGLFQWPGSAPPKNPNDDLIKWTLVLPQGGFLTIASDEHPEPTLVLFQKDQFFEEAASYHCFICALYGLPLQDGTDILHDAAGIADRYLALRGFRQPALAKLLDQSLETTMSEISTDPVKYLDIGHKLSSFQIFSEAFVHCVGQYAQLRTHPAFQALSGRVQEAVKKEYERLKDLQIETWLKVWGAEILTTPTLLSDLHKVFRWYGELQTAPTAYGGQYAGLMALALSGWSRPQSSPGRQFDFQSRGLTAYETITAPLAKGTKWSQVSASTPYLLCAEVDLSLLDTEELS